MAICGPRALHGLRVFRGLRSQIAQHAFTLLELIITCTVLLILASAVIPMATNGIKRQKELELRRDLREMRLAIDAYKLAVDQQKIKAPPVENMGYPESLEVLVEGTQANGTLSGKIRFFAPHPRGPIHGPPRVGNALHQRRNQ